MIPEPDLRSPEQQAEDERIAAEPQLAPPVIPPGAVPQPVEVYLARQRQPVAIAGIVENGLIRPLDPSVKLPERLRVVIVAVDGTSVGSEG